MKLKYTGKKTKEKQKGNDKMEHWEKEKQID